MALAQSRSDGGLNPGVPRESAKASMDEYVVEPPDLILVEVLEALPDQPIQGERLVRPDGTLNLGFYGEVYVAGLTLREIKAKVIAHLRNHLGDEQLGLIKADPKRPDQSLAVAPEDSTRVRVDVVAYNSKCYYVQGEVAAPGRFMSRATTRSSTRSTMPGASRPRRLEITSALYGQARTALVPARSSRSISKRFLTREIPRPIISSGTETAWWYTVIPSFRNRRRAWRPRRSNGGSKRLKIVSIGSSSSWKRARFRGRPR